MGRHSFLRLVMGLLLAVPALSDSVKGLLGYPHRRTDQIDDVSYTCPPNKFIIAVSLQTATFVDYLDSITCEGSLTIPIKGGNAALGTATVYMSDTYGYFVKQSHGTTGGHVTQLFLGLGSEAFYGPLGSDAMVETVELSDQAPSGGFAMGVRVSADAGGLTDFQFIYAVLDVACGADHNHECTQWEGCCSQDDTCGVTDASCGAGCQTDFGTCNTSPTTPTVAPTTSLPTSMPTMNMGTLMPTMDMGTLKPTMSMGTQKPTAMNMNTPTPTPTTMNMGGSTPMPVANGVAPEDLEITFNIKDRTVATFTTVDMATLITSTAKICGVPEANIKISPLFDVTINRGRRLVTQMIAVSILALASPVATNDITDAGLEALTGFVIEDFMVMPASMSMGGTPTQSPADKPTSMPTMNMGTQPPTMNMSTQQPTSLSTLVPTMDMGTLTPTSNSTMDMTTPMPVTATGAPQDLDVTFNIMGMSVASFTAQDMATLTTASASIAGVPEANVEITLADATSTGRRRLQTQMIAVSEYITASPVATGDITAAALSSLTGFVIEDVMAMPAAPSGSEGKSNVGLLAGVIAAAVVLCCIVGCVLNGHRIRKQAAKLEKEKDTKDIVLSLNGEPLPQGKAASILTGATPAPFGASDRKPLPIGVAVPEVERGDLTYTAAPMNTSFHNIVL